MAVVWSWAFGAETHTELDFMGWGGVSNQTVPVTGSVATAFKVQSTYDNNNIVLDIVGNVDGDRCEIVVTNSSTGTVAGRVNGTVAGTATLPAGDWHYVSFTYDMSTTTYSAEFFANGVSFGSATNSNFTNAQTGVAVRIEGVGQFIPNASLHAQLLAYDNATSAADAATPMFVTQHVYGGEQSLIGRQCGHTG